MKDQTKIIIVFVGFVLLLIGGMVAGGVIGYINGYDDATQVCLTVFNPEPSPYGNVYEPVEIYYNLSDNKTLCSEDFYNNETKECDLWGNYYY